MKNNMKEKSFWEQISTKPSRSSIEWGANNYSLLSAILLNVIWIARIFSLLQIGKLVYRKIAQRLLAPKDIDGKKTLIDNVSGRVNVPPLFCEIYFLIWLLYLIAVHHLPTIFCGNIVRWTIIYYLFESIVWVLYYTIFRRFFEEGYSIYHELEYLTNLLLVIPTQALCFASLYQMSFREMLSGLLGAGSDQTPFPVTIMGALFGAIVISMIISTFPLEAVRKHAPKYQMLILGKGDVVENRLVPAIKNCMDHKNCSHTELDLTDGTPEKLCKLIKANASKDTIVWIETPTPSHRFYIEQLLGLPLPLIAVEKPIAHSIDDLKDIETLVQNPSNRKKLFFLSYYLLEKALPLHYLTTSNSYYEKYLDIDDKAALINWRQRLGHLNSISVQICEGTDTRKWPNQKENGGQLIETFIHNMLIATLFCGLPSSWEKPNWKWEKDTSSTPNPTTIEMTTTKKKTSIHLLMKKNIVTEQEKTRFAQLDFSNGSIYADFSNQSATISFDDIDTECTIAVTDLFCQKYSIQLDLAKRVHGQECRSDEVDGLTNQIDVLKWLLEANNNIEETIVK